MHCTAHESCVCSCGHRVIDFVRRKSGCDAAISCSSGLFDQPDCVYQAWWWWWWWYLWPPPH